MALGQKCLGAFWVEKVQVIYYNRIMLGGVLIPPNRRIGMNQEKQKRVCENERKSKIHSVL